jgi:hypothetical protein
MGQDKIQNRELGADVLNGMFAAIAEVLPTNSSISMGFVNPPFCLGFASGI